MGRFGFDAIMNNKRPTRRIGVVALIAFAPLAAAGCGTVEATTGEKTVRVAKVESKIREVLTEQVGAEVKSVDCPKSIPVRKGSVISCAVTGRDGSRARMNVRQTNDRGGIHVSNKLLMHRREVEADIVRQLQGRLGDQVAVRCPDLAELRAGAQFDCPVSGANGGARAVVVRATDNAGAVEYVLR